MGGMASGLIGTGLQVGGSLMDMDGRRRAQRQQEQNLNNWYLYQAMIRNAEMQRQDQFRAQADASRMNVLNNDLSADAQKAKQAAEQTRLGTEYAKGTSADTVALPASDATIAAGTQRTALTGQSGGGDEFRSDLARRLNNASAAARNRITALATMNSFGDSFKGLGTENPLALQRSGQDINMFNNFRRGSLSAYGVEKAIQPQQVQYNGSPAAMGVQAVGGFFSGLGKQQNNGTGF